jgi:hypothetical protein
MFAVYEYSHFGGSEILKTRFPEVEREVNAILAAVRLGKSTTRPKARSISRDAIDNRFKSAFRQAGFRPLEMHCLIPVFHPSRLKMQSERVRFFKSGVMCEVQLGSYGEMLLDLAKFDQFNAESRGEVGVEIVPAHRLKMQMSTGVAYGEQLIFDIGRLRRHFPAVPVKVILIDVEPRPETVIEVVEGEEDSLATQEEDWQKEQRTASKAKKAKRVKKK